MDEIELTLTREGAQALRDFADALLKSTENIEEATNVLSTVFSENSCDLGVHSGDFEEMLEHIKTAKQKGQDAIASLIPGMHRVAERIDAYVDKLPSASGGASGGGGGASGGGAGGGTSKSGGGCRHLSTINEDLDGKTHPVTGVGYSRKEFTINGERIEGVFPNFESKFSTSLSPSLLLESDDKQFKACTKSLAEQIESDPALKARFTPRQLEQIKNGEPRISGLTWHHKEHPPGSMILVSADIHGKTGHTGGRSIWGGGSDCR